MTLSAWKPRQKTCRNADCRSKFMPDRPMQIVCGVPCAVALAKVQMVKEKRQKARAERVAIREAKAKIKRRSDHMREAQQAFNEFIRIRDAALPCISCGRHHEGQYHAGHYRTVGAHPELRFEPLNVHKQCAPCNNHKSGDIVNYRISLVERIGADQVEWLEGPHEAKKYSIEELQAIKAKYRALVRDMKKGAA